MTLRLVYRADTLCSVSCPSFSFVFFFNDTATTEIYTLSLHDALPISDHRSPDSRELWRRGEPHGALGLGAAPRGCGARRGRSEEHTSELQSQSNLVCRLLLEKKKKTSRDPTPSRRNKQAMQ